MINYAKSVVYISTTREFEDKGSGFFIKYNERQILITAQHVVYFGGKPPGVIYIKLDEIIRCEVESIITPNGDILGIYLKQELDIPNLTPQVSLNYEDYGQNIYCLGFPYDVLHFDKYPNTKTPLPIIKKGIISSIAPDDSFNISCLAVHGMSGGPIVVKDSNGSVRALGVISFGGAFHLISCNDKRLLRERDEKSHSDTVLCFPLSMVIDKIEKLVE